MLWLRLPTTSRREDLTRVRTSLVRAIDRSWHRRDNRQRDRPLHEGAVAETRSEDYG